MRAYNLRRKQWKFHTITSSTNPNTPLAPVAASAVGISQTTFTANWSAATGASGYRLDVSMSASFGTYLPGYQDMDVGDSMRRITGLSTGSTFYYRVRAYNITGTSVKPQLDSCHNSAESPSPTGHNRGDASTKQKVRRRCRGPAPERPDTGWIYQRATPSAHLFPATRIWTKALPRAQQ